NKLALVIGERLRQRFPSGEPLPLELLQGEGPLASRLTALESAMLKSRPDRQHADIKKELGAERRRLTRVHGDLLQVVGDRQLLMEVVARSGGEITEKGVDAVVEHTRVQFSATAEE